MVHKVKVSTFVELNHSNQAAIMATHAEHPDSVEVSLATSPRTTASRERSSDLSFAYTLRKVFSGEPDIDRKEAQPLASYDCNAHIEIDGRTYAIKSSSAVDEGEATIDGAYNMRKAKSCPISVDAFIKQSSGKKRGIFVKRRGKSKSSGEGGKKLQKNTTFDESRCSTLSTKMSSFSEDDLQDKPKKGRLNPWMITLIISVCALLGTGAYACVYFLPDIISGKANTVVGYKPTNISISPPFGDGVSITFYAMGDAPYTDHERENIMPYQMQNLSDSAAFLVHLGDLQDAQVDECQEYAYQAASDILKQSRLPVFVIPGDNDINDCDDFEHGQEQWMKHFHLLDKNWNHDFLVARWGKLEESFAFLRNRVLFFGLNIVGGSPHFDHEWKSRHNEHLFRVKDIMTKLEDDYDVTVLLAHASPGSYHEDFFEDENGLAAFVKDIGKPFLHLHGDDHIWAETDGAFDVDNYMMVSLDSGEIASPIKVQIDTSKKNPIKISREDANLEVQCCSEGWPWSNNEEVV